jgi:hypothetical protein
VERIGNTKPTTKIAVFQKLSVESNSRQGFTQTLTLEKSMFLHLLEMWVSEWPTSGSHSGGDRVAKIL